MFTSHCPHHQLLKYFHIQDQLFNSIHSPLELSRSRLSLELPLLELVVIVVTVILNQLARTSMSLESLAVFDLGIITALALVVLASHSR